MKLICACALAAGLMLVAGCESPQPQHTVRMTGDPVVDGENMLTITPEKDKVLLQDETALTAMRRGQFADAKRLLDATIARLEGIYGPDKSARQSRGLFHSESKKTFLGEPYERVMAYYYRGIIYWMDGEPDNARACFRSGQLIDSDTENKTYAGDYILLDYLDALATSKLHGDGNDAFARAKKLSTRQPLPPLDPEANVLIFLEFGAGPVKYATGNYREELRFGEGSSPVQSAIIHVDSFAETSYPYDDLFFQATTRGGRVMDHILANKAVFKTATDVAGDVGILGGAVMAMDRDTRDVGLGLLAAGVVSKVISAATTPEADVRAWNNLPRFLTFAPLRMQPGSHALSVEFKDRFGATVPSLTKTVTFTVPATGDKVLFLSDQSATSLTL